MNRLFLKVFLFFFLSIHIFSCWSNPYAPFNFVECDDGNINGKNEKVCKLKKKMILFTNGFYLLLSTKTDSSAGVTSHTISGIISNPNDNTPYTNHSLTVHPNNLSTTTDGNGNYTFSLPAGTYTITIKDANGNTIGTLTLIVSSGGGISVSVSTGLVKMTANGVTGVPDTVATPTFSVASGTYNTDQSISITCATSDVTIFYTTDNSTPATSVGGSTSQYSSAISVSGNGTSRTIKAIAVKSGLVNSAVASGSWVINYDVVATPAFSPTAGTFTSDQSISISTTTSGATIYYTTDNSTPATSVSGSTSQYSSAISISGNGTSRTIKAIAVKSGLVNSTVASGSWTINYESIDLWNGIVAYYPFNGNAKDESGVNSNHGTVYGATLTSDKFGTTNKAYSFDGVNDYIVINDSPNLDISASGTISIFYQASVDINLNVYGKPHLISKGATFAILWADYNIFLNNNNSFKCEFSNSSNIPLYGCYYENTSIYNFNHIVITFNSGIVKIYENGIKKGEETFSISEIRASNQPLYIGHRFINGGMFKGIIDDARIYNRALNASEVQSLYENLNTAPTVGNSGTITTSSITSTSLTLNWTKATDGNASGEYATPQNKLQYKVVQSSSNNINTVDNAETNGTVIQNWTTDINTKNITGLTAGQTYYFNVLVRDEHGNKGVYTTKSQTMVYWTAAGNMVTGRKVYQNFAVLPDGKILIAGGSGSSGLYMNSSEIYNPVTGLFTLTDNLNTNNYWPITTILQNGKVLVTGGLNAGTFIQSTELYDNSTGNFTNNGNMNSPRLHHIIALLDNGKVLLAGGTSSSGTYLSSAELFDSNSGIFTYTGNLTVARYQSKGIKMLNGKVLVVGGNNNGSYHSSAEVYDPTTGIFILTGNMNESRNNPNLIVLQNGKILITGGQSCTWGCTHSSAEVYDLTTGIFTITGNMNEARVGHASTILNNGKILITGGGNGSGTNALSSVEIYDPDTGIFTLTANMTTARYHHGIVKLSDGRVMVFGGSIDSSNYTNTTEIYSP